jgi:hypothetical protein
MRHDLKMHTSQVGLVSGESMKVVVGHEASKEISWPRGPGSLKGATAAACSQ